MGKDARHSDATLVDNASEPVDDTGPTTSEAAGDEMMQLLYHELRKLAAAKLKRSPSGQQTLQPTDLVHEVYVRLAKNPNKRWKNRRHFFRTAALAMRHILVERARARMTDKRGGQWIRADISVSLADKSDTMVLSYEDFLTLDNALTKLQAEYPDLVEIVLMRYFCGLTVAEIAMLIGKSTRTVERNWSFARAWLFTELDNQHDRCPV